jgi:hypothetical protein
MFLLTLVRIATSLPHGERLRDKRARADEVIE